MKLVAMLCWYEEDPNWLAALVASLHKAGVSHLVACDGAYMLFPDAGERPRSGCEQAAAITETAHMLDIGVTVHRPIGPWRGNEVAKRNHLLNLALMETDPDDWLLQLDADETVTHAPYDLHRRLEQTEHDVAGVYFYQRNVTPPPTVENSVPKFNPLTMEEGFLGHRILFRARRDLRIEHAHYQYTIGPSSRPRYLRGVDDWYDLEPALSIPELKVEHRHNHRQPARNEAAAEYYELRALHMVERLRPEGQPVGV